MPLPDCIRRLLPPLPDLVEIPDLRARWTINGAPVTPYFRDQWNTFALCEVKGYAPPEYRDQGKISISVEILQRALQLAERLDITAVSIENIDVSGEPSPMIALIGLGSETAIVVAPRLDKDARKNSGVA